MAVVSSTVLSVDEEPSEVAQDPVLHLSSDVLQADETQLS